MLPVGHIAYTWAAVVWLRSHGRAEDVDLRSAALASLLPDLVDKPLALTVLSGSGTSQGPSHALASQVLVTLAVAIFKRTWLPYALASNCHLVADRMWKYRRTLLFPFSRQLDRWKFMGTPAAMLGAYAEIATRPAILAVEAGGLFLLGWIVRRYGLCSRHAVMHLLRTGKLGAIHHASGARE